MFKKIIPVCFVLLTGFYSNAQNLLAIPDTLSGTTFNLSIIDTSHTFYSGFVTNTFGINASYLGPTLIFNQNDSVSITVHNELMDTTTIHWHGLHVSPINDGGPHIYIPPMTSWNPKFKVRDNAATYWYHPHLHMMTNMHASMGAAGLIIVRDATEAALNLPRRYGIDDFPLVIQSKCFDNSKQIQIDNAYDSAMMVNGTIDPYLPVPAQVIRFRILNASSERVYYYGLTSNQTFYQIATDGGLLNSPVALTRLRLAPGERAEILIDFGGMNGQQVDLINFGSSLPNGVYGALQPGMGAGQIIPGYTSNPLNGANYSIITFQIGAPSTGAITTIPTSLVVNTPWSTSLTNNTRTLVFSPVNTGSTAIQGPFYINDSLFDMNNINYSTPRNNIEMWTLDNQSPIAHPFHIHDVQFYITDMNGTLPPANMQGRKDVVLVLPMQTVTFITKFETFCDDAMPYMYHCHMLPHEDDGMMGQFIVTCPPVSVNENESELSKMIIFPNPSSDYVQFNNTETIKDMKVIDETGRIVLHKNDSIISQVNIQFLENGLYFIRLNNSKEVFKFLKQ